MSRDILSDEEGKKFGFVLNTFWNGKEESVQLTLLSDKGYAWFSRSEAIKLFRELAEKLAWQAFNDGRNPLWWQHQQEPKEEKNVAVLGEGEGK